MHRYLTGALCALFISVGVAGAEQHMHHVPAKLSTTDQTTCLALNIYHEARSEPLDGQLVIAFVTLNRVKSDMFPDNICDVVWQIKPAVQFSWTLDGKQDLRVVKQYWDLAVILANEVVSGATKPFIMDDVLFYKATYAKSTFFDKLELVGGIGKHQFYAIQ